jgi:hypothetical protein
MPATDSGYSNGNSNSLKVPAGRPAKRLCDREDLPGKLRLCKGCFKLKHPPSYYKTLEESVKPAPGLTWYDVELDRALHSSRAYYTLPEFKEKAAQQQPQARERIKVIKETCTTWDNFKDYLTKHKTVTKTTRDLADATRLCKEIGYIPSLFQTLYLV